VKKRIVVAVSAVLLMAMVAAAQDVKPANSLSSDGQNAAGMSKKTFNLSGEVADSGKSFVTDQDHRVWAVANPEALAISVGDHVTLVSRINAEKHELQVVKVMTDTSAGARLHDAAFRR